MVSALSRVSVKVVCWPRSYASCSACLYSARPSCHRPKLTNRARPAITKSVPTSEGAKRRFAKRMLKIYCVVFGRHSAVRLDEPAPGGSSHSPGQRAPPHDAHQVPHRRESSRDHREPRLRIVSPRQRQGRIEEDGHGADGPHRALRRALHPAVHRLVAGADSAARARPLTAAVSRDLRAPLSYPRTASHYPLPRYSQYTKMNKPSHTTSTKCQYQATPSNAKCCCGVKWPFNTRIQITSSMIAPMVTC